jgi:hypothetical protein
MVAPASLATPSLEQVVRLRAAVRWSIREHGSEPSCRQIDELFDERLASFAYSLTGADGARLGVPGEVR